MAVFSGTALALTAAGAALAGAASTAAVSDDVQDAAGTVATAGKWATAALVALLAWEAISDG